MPVLNVCRSKNILAFAIQNIAGWANEDEIRIESKCACYGIMPVLMMEKGFEQIFLSKVKTPA